MLLRYKGSGLTGSSFTRPALLAILFFACQLYAENFGLQVVDSAFDYNYLDVTGIITSGEGNGFGIKASVDIEPNFAMMFSIVHTQQSKESNTYLSLGIAYHQLLNKTQIPSLDWIMHLSFEAASINDKHKHKHTQTPNDHRHISHDVGLRIGTGLRYQIIKNIDVYSDMSVSTTTHSTVHIRIGATYDLTPSFNLYSSYEFSDCDKLFLGFRYLY
jgi:hypothetical protein